MSTHQMHRLIAFSVLTASLLVPALVRAQDAAPAAAIIATEVVATTPAAAPTAPVDGPRVMQSGVTRSSVSAAPAAPPQYRSDRSNVAWMVVGGAALVVGSMIGGDAGTIIMITGGVIGLMGLFRYMQ